MPTVTWTPSGFNFYVEAEMRAYMQSVHDALLAVGCVQTTDTGQLDIATAVAATGSPSQYYVTYAPLIYKWPGVNGYPDLYIRLVFNIANRFSTNTCNVPSAQVSISTGTNGAGVLTGQVIWAQPTIQTLQNGFAYANDNLGGVASSGDDYLAICTNPGRQSATTNLTWAVPFFAIERQKNGDYHCSQVYLQPDIRSSPLPNATAAISTQSVVAGQISALSPGCAFIGTPNTLLDQIVGQRFYRRDRVKGIDVFKPLITVPATHAFGSVLTIGGEGYTSCGSVGNRTSIGHALTWFPAMKTG